ncbi:MAG: WG repeat-containing protein, partial [Bacteroidales bacterium]|nr:WG repeat-containing protein [Bacteroidales bacterium]
MKKFFLTLAVSASMFLTASAQRIWRAWNFHEGFAMVQAAEQKGYCFIDRTGKRVTDFYESASDFSDGVAIVEKEGKWRILDTAGKESVILNYEQVRYRGFREGLLPVRQNGKWGYADKTGKPVIPCIYENAGIFHDGV